MDGAAVSEKLVDISHNMRRAVCQQYVSVLYQSPLTTVL